MSRRGVQVEHRADGWMREPHESSYPGPKLCTAPSTAERRVCPELPRWRVQERRGNVLGTAYFCNHHVPVEYLLAEANGDPS